MTNLAPFYPIVPDATWAARFAQLGVKMMQLRIKDTDEASVRTQISQSLEACARKGTTLVVNDYWRESIELGVRAVHLGQTDLQYADLAAIRAAGLMVGISTHSEEELEITLAVRPDYVALGPIYETTLKKMPFAPQGLARIAEWKARIDCPLVAIGGITLERAREVYAAGADSIAVVSDVIAAPDPDARVQAWLALSGVPVA